MNKLLLTPILFVLVGYASPIFFTNSFVQSINTINLTYSSIIEETPIELGSALTFECIFTVRVDLVNNSVEIVEVKGDFNKLIEKHLYMVLKTWLDNTNIYEKVESREYTYVSVNGKIIRAYVIHTSRGTIYRDAKTGLYVGGLEHYILTTKYPRGYSYHIVLNSFLTRVDPGNYVEYMDVVEIPIDEVRATLTIASIIVLVLASNTIVKWDRYRIL